MEIAHARIYKMDADIRLWLFVNLMSLKFRITQIKEARLLN